MRPAAALSSLLAFILIAPAARADPEPAAPPSSPQAEFDRRALGFEDWVAYNVHSGAVVNHWSVPVEGKYRRPLRYDEFYTLVGRRDLAGRYRTRRAARIGLMVVGSLLMAGGIAAMIGQISANHQAWSDCFDRNFGNLGADAEDCNATASNAGYIAGGVLGGVGVIGVFAGIFYNPQPVEPYVARELADEYNQRLRHQLGLDAPPPGPPPAPSGSGLVLSARF